MATMTPRPRPAWHLLGAVILAASVAGCAAGPTSGPRKMKTEDFKWLAGQWRGSAYVQAEPVVAVEGVIYENGSFFIAPRGTPGAQQPGQMKVVNEEVVYDSPTSEGKMIFQEAPSEWIWTWEGKTKIGDKKVTHELRKPK